MKDNRRKEIKPKNKPSQEEITPQPEQERITEKLSISVPTQPLLRPHGVISYLGQRVRLLLRDGTVIVGFLQKRVFNFVHLLNIEEIRQGERLTAPWCDVELGSISRVYPADAKVMQVQRP